jgi:hypothetical protein
MSDSRISLNLFDLQHGWSDYHTVDEVVFENRVEWYWGDIEVSAVQVMLAESIISPAFAKVTVWFRGVGTTHYVADAPSLAAYITKVLPGVKALAHQEYLVIE